MTAELLLKLEVWKRLNNETLQYMRMLDYWIMFLIGLLVFLIWVSRQPLYHDAIVLAALVGAIAPVWIGRLDVLIHRPAAAVRNIEHEIEVQLTAEMLKDPETADDPQFGPAFKSWESYYKPRLGTGVKILAPLDAIALVLLLVLFVHANSWAWQYLIGTSWNFEFYYGCWAVFLIGIGIIAFAKPLAK